jgi:hypothetical protein
MTPQIDAGLDPAGMAQSIADMMLARKGSPGDIIANITDVVQNPDEDDGMEPRAEII